jgi:hypothetical protein
MSHLSVFDAMQTQHLMLYPDRYHPSLTASSVCIFSLNLCLSRLESTRVYLYPLHVACVKVCVCVCACVILFVLNTIRVVMHLQASYFLASYFLAHLQPWNLLRVVVSS